MQKNYFLYFFSFIASVFVVFIHCKFEGMFGDIIETIARFAVPFFFIIIGYYSSNITKEKSLKKANKHLLQFLKLLLLYFIIRIIVILIVDKNSLNIFFSNILSIKNIMKFILFNNTTVIASPLWYLIALVYCYLFIYFMGDNWKKFMNVFMIIPIIEIPIAAFIVSKFGIQYTVLFRNWFTIGLPFISIGAFINLKKEKLLSISNKKIVFIIMIGIFLTCLERLFLKCILDSKINLYYGAVITSIFLFILCLNNNTKLKKLGSLVSNLSENIYYYHYIFVILFDELVLVKFNSKIISFFEPLIVLFMTIILSLFISRKQKGVKK